MSPSRSGKSMNAVDDLELEPGPGPDRGDASVPSSVPALARSPAVHDDLKLEPGRVPERKSDFRFPCAPAPVHRREVSSPSDARVDRPSLPEPSQPIVS